MISTYRYYFEQRKAARIAVVLKEMQTISRGSQLLMEAHSKLRHVYVELPAQDIPLQIGAYSYVRSNSRINYLREIGRYCSIGRNVTLGETPRNHPLDWVATSLAVSHQYQGEDRYACIGHDVWIGHDAVIMAGINVGHGAVIGRNAIVTKDVEPYQIVAGNPARPIRFRFDEGQRQALLSSEWWNLDYAALRQLPFDDVDRFLTAVASVSQPAQFKSLRVLARKVSLL